MSFKTAEEIIFGFGYYPSKKGTAEGQLIVKAMEEYAAQFIKPTDCYNCDGTGKVCNTDCVVCKGNRKLIILPTITNTTATS